MVSMGRDSLGLLNLKGERTFRQVDTACVGIAWVSEPEAEREQVDSDR